MDAVANTKLASEYSITSYPTIKMVAYSALGSKHSVDFKLRSMRGGQEIENLTDFARDNADVKAAEARAEAAARAKEEAEKAAAKEQDAKAAAQPADAAVRIVTDKTWKAEQAKAMEGSGQFFVKFFAPWVSERVRPPLLQRARCSNSHCVRAIPPFLCFFTYMLSAVTAKRWLRSGSKQRSK